jgi:predicted nucleotidyltransferase
LEALSEELTLFATWAQPQPDEVRVRRMVESHITGLVSQLWPTAKVELFGSSACGLALPSSDLDVLVTGIEDFNPNLPAPHFDQLHQLLNSNGITEVAALPNARVPLVKYCDPRARVWVDVSFLALNSTNCIPVVKGYLNQFPLLKPLVTIFKTILRQTGLHKPHEGGLGSYAVVLLLVSFLRVRASAGTDVHNISNLGLLFVTFLRFFSNSALDCAFTPGAQDPFGEIRSVRGRLEIWDPLDNNNNVAYSCRRVEQIQYICTITVERLSWFDPNHYSSVLATVIDPSDQNLRLPVHQVLPFVPPECGEPPKSTTTACTGTEELEPWAVPPSIAEVQVKTASNALLALDVAGAEHPDRECETPSGGVNVAATADWATIQPLQRSVTPGRLRTQTSAPRRMSK